MRLTSKAHDDGIPDMLGINFKKDVRKCKDFFHGLWWKYRVYVMCAAVIAAAAGLWTWRLFDF